MDDHFNQYGKFLYTDNKKTNNIVIDYQNPITGELNTAPWLSKELKDYLFDNDNAYVLANIANHYAKEAGINLKNLKGNSTSVGLLKYHTDAGQKKGRTSSYNGGEYNDNALVEASKLNKTVTLMVANNKVSPLYNNRYNMISALSHEGGKVSHLTINPDYYYIPAVDLAKEHIIIYQHQISSPIFKQTTVPFQNEMKKNYESDKAYYRMYGPK